MIPPPSRDAADPIHHYAFIDALRGVAFLLVLSIHAKICANLKPEGVDFPLWWACEKGRFGVQLFFVISAFTLAQSLDARSARDARPLRAFFARRSFRIAPLFWAAIAFYLAWYGLAARSSAPGGISAANIALTATFLHGWSPETINSLVPGGWSIAVEMVFYLTLPAAHRLFRTPGRLLILLAGTEALALALAFVDAPGRLYPAWRSGHPDLGDDFAYFWLPNQYPVFVLGLMFYAVRRGPGKVPVAWTLAGLALSVAVSLAHPSLRHLLYSVGFTLLAWGLSIRPVGVLVNRATRFLGKISFSAYLTHFAALDLASRLLGLDTPSLPRSAFCERFVPPLADIAALPGPARLAILVAVALPLTVLFSSLTFRFIEEPGVRLGKRAIKAAGW